jgi:ketosteroid isomerase-like protein
MAWRMGLARNHWTATDSQSGKKLEFRGIVIWRIANGKIVERWAYLGTPHPA